MKPAAGLSWVVEDFGVTLFCREKGLHFSIPYPMAGLWSLVANGNYDRETARDLIALLRSVDPTESDDAVRAALTSWRGMGLLEEG